MRNIKFTVILLILSGFLFVSANSPQTATESEISQFVELFVKEWNKHDPNELIKLWAENGDLMNPAGEWEKGKANVLKILLREHQGVLRESQMKQEVTKILVLSPTLAWVDANVRLTIPGIPRDLERNLDHHIVYLLVKENNQWKILATRPYQFLEIHLGLFESEHAANGVGR